jgi:hypothetical protein
MPEDKANSSPSPRVGWIFWLMIVLGLGLRLIPLILPLTRFITHVPDDAFYLYRIAANLAEHGFLSFDGVMPTTTARPLYIIMLSGMKMVTGTQALPQIAYLLGVLADIATAMLIFRFLRRLDISARLALVGMGAYLFSSRTILFVCNGMETPWAVLAVAAYLNLLIIGNDSKRWNVTLALGRGLLLGAMMLLRLDFVFLAVPLWLGEVYHVMRQRNYGFAISGAVAGLIIAPWALWSWGQFGSLMPPSGDALSMLLGASFTPDWAGFVGRLELLYDSLSDLFPLLFIKYQPWLGIGLGVVFILLLVKWVETAVFKRSLGSLAPLWMGAMAMVVYFGGVRLFWREWNLVVGDLLFAILLGIVVDGMLRRGISRLAPLAIIVFMLGSSLNYAADYWDGVSPGQASMCKAATWVRDNTPDGTVVAATNGGILAWYGERIVVDAAGIEDTEAYKALKAHMLYGYLKDRGVEYLVDPPNWPFEFYREYWGVNIDDKLFEVYDSDDINSDRDLFTPIVYQFR